jgi:hypothetical protein
VFLEKEIPFVNLNGRAGKGRPAGNSVSKVSQCQEGIKVLEWLTAALAPLNGKGGRGFLMWVGNISHTF